MKKQMIFYRSIFKIISILIITFYFPTPNALAAERQPVKLPKEVSETSIIHSKKHYPPYPDVWDWQLPFITATLGNGLYIMPNGDALIRYHKSLGKNNERDYAALLFEGKKYTGEDEVIMYEEANYNLQEFKKKKGLSELYDSNDFEAASYDGKWIIRRIIPKDLICFTGRNSSPYRLINTKTRQEKIFTIFRLLDKPKPFYICGSPKPRGESCIDASCFKDKKIFRYKVESIYGNIIFLKDNSFLFQETSQGKNVKGAGVVIRFDTNLKTKSSIIGDYLFLFENKGGANIISELTGKQYKDNFSPEEEAELLYEYLIKIKKEGRK